MISNQQSNLPNTTLFKKVYGCLMGGSIGDAMGGPVEAMHYRAIRERVGKVTDLREYKSPPGILDPKSLPAYTVGKTAAGSYTDDTRLKHLLCQAIIDKGGRITAEDLAETWKQKMNPEEFWHSIKSSFYKIALSNISPRNAGRGNIPDNSSPMCIAPIGIINIADPERASLEAYDVASLSHNGYAQESATIVAAAVAEAMSTETTVDSVINASISYVGKNSKVARRVRKVVDLADKCSDTFDFTKKFYEKFLVLWSIPDRLKIVDSKDFSPSVDPLEAVPVALAIFYIEKGEPKNVIIEAANFGRDCDTIAGMAGGIAGAYKGIDAIPEDWVKTSHKANPEPDQKEIALQLTKVIVKIKEQLSGRLAHLDKLLKA